MPEQLMQFKATAPMKAIMTLMILLTLVSAWLAVRWYVGNTIAEYFHPEDHRLQTAQLAVTLAPNDPVPHWRLGNLAQTELPPAQIGLVVAEYEKAVGYCPTLNPCGWDWGGARRG